MLSSLSDFYQWLFCLHSVRCLSQQINIKIQMLSTCFNRLVLSFSSSKMVQNASYQVKMFVWGTARMIFQDALYVSFPLFSQVPKSNGAFCAVCVFNILDVALCLKSALYQITLFQVILVNLAGSLNNQFASRNVFILTICVQ